MVRSRGSPMTPAALSAQPSPGAGNCDLTFARRQCQPTTLALPEWDAALAADRCNCATPDRENWIRTGSHVFSRFRCIACLYTRTLSLSLEIRASRGSRSSRCFFFFFFFYFSFREIEFFREREREREVLVGGCFDDLCKCRESAPWFSMPKRIALFLIAIDFWLDRFLSNVMGGVISW